MIPRTGRWWFLAVTGLAVGTELWFALDGDPGSVPWTGYLIRLPWWLLLPLALGFTIWLPWHLVDAKRRAGRSGVDQQDDDGDDGRGADGQRADEQHEL